MEHPFRAVADRLAAVQAMTAALALLCIAFCGAWWFARKDLEVAKMNQAVRDELIAVLLNEMLPEGEPFKDRPELLKRFPALGKDDPLRGLLAEAGALMVPGRVVTAEDRAKLQKAADKLTKKGK